MTYFVTRAVPAANQGRFLGIVEIFRDGQPVRRFDKPNPREPNSYTAVGRGSTPDVALAKARRDAPLLMKWARQEGRI